MIVVPDELSSELVVAVVDTLLRFSAGCSGSGTIVTGDWH